MLAKYTELKVMQFLHVLVIHGEKSQNCIVIDSVTGMEQHHGVPSHIFMDSFSFGTILYDLFERQERP